MYHVETNKTCRVMPKYRPLREPYDSPNRWPSCGVGLFSTPRDLMEFYRMLAFGRIESVHTMSGRLTSLDIDFPDHYMISIRHEGGSKGMYCLDIVARKGLRRLETRLDYYGRVPRREIELYTADDVVVCDFINAEIRFFKSGRRIDLAEERNEYCLREIGYFFDFAMSGAENINSIPYANRISESVLTN